MNTETPSWGIEPVPDRLRVLGVFDSFLLWTNFGVSILVLVAASYLGLSLKQALLATLLGGIHHVPAEWQGLGLGQRVRVRGGARRHVRDARHCDNQDR